jgi:hypothetical protein
VSNNYIFKPADVYEELEKFAQQNKTDLNFNFFCQDVPKTIKADGPRFSYMAKKLITNAVRRSKTSNSYVDFKGAPDLNSSYHLIKIKFYSVSDISEWHLLKDNKQ